MSDKLTRQSIYSQISQSMRSSFEESRQLPHPGEKGRAAELVLRNFLSKHLPKRFEVCSGFILDKEDNVSGQTDVIIYDSLNCPVYSVHDDLRIIPSDNVAAVVEVKSTLRNQDFNDAATKASVIKHLVKTPEQPSKEMVLTNTYVSLFAFDSDLPKEKVCELHATSVNGRGLTWHLDSVCILDKVISYTSVEIEQQTQGPQPMELSALNPAVTRDRLTKFSISAEEKNQDSLEIWLRLLLAHLSFFRHRVDHPGFDWDRSTLTCVSLFDMPRRNPERNDPCYCLSGNKWKYCHGA